jgi:hypothetical protein
MGIASVYVDSDDLLVIVWHGRVSGAEWKQNVDAQLGDDPTWPRGRRRLIDLMSLGPSDLSSADIETVISFGRGRILDTGSRQAVVASRAWDLAWDLAGEFARRSNELGSTTIVFDRIDWACAWLGVDPDSLRPVIATLRTELGG